MIYYAAKEFTAAHAGALVKEVCCQKCNTTYYYKLTRTGIGQGSAPYFIGQKSAAARAEAAAEKALAKRLAGEAELVPCPKCYWLNEDLVIGFRKKIFPAAPMLVLFLLIIAAVASLGLLPAVLRALSYRNTDPSMGLVLFVTSLVTIAVAIIPLRNAFRRWRVNPNQTWPRRPVLPAGTPAAWMPDERTQELVRVAAPAATGERDQLWAVYRGELLMPPQCCVCMADTDDTYRPLLSMTSANEITGVPTCRRCNWRLRLKWFLWLLAIALICAALGTAAALLPRKIDDFGRWFAFILVTGLGTLTFGTLTAAHMARPYRHAVIDASRSLFKFRATNAAFTQRVAAIADEAENSM